jgi:tetratricopeptide (TPR) repeat protein
VLSLPAAAPLEKRVDGGSEPLARAPQAGSLAFLPGASPFREVATAHRQQDFDAVRRKLSPLAQEQSPNGGVSRLLLGFYAHANEDVELAREMLLAAVDPTGELEDWRLLLLADSAQALDDNPAALASLTELLTAFPASPLCSYGALSGVEVAQATGDPDLTLDWIERARLHPLDKETSAALETTAWELAAALADRPRQQEAARRLLVHHPLEASKLEVVELFRQPNGEIEWLEFLTPAELELRARNLLAIDLTDGALASLEAVPESHRGFDWHLTVTAAPRRWLFSIELVPTASASDRVSSGNKRKPKWTWPKCAGDATTCRRASASG